ncbi:MAG: chemotaxis protein CheX [Desulfitobacteriaceae bacterium]
MDVKLINPILTAFSEILPQIGFSSVEKRGISLTGSTININGVLVNIGFTGVIKGVILIGMDIDSAMQFASKMMMGMELVSFDVLAQSAISEMGNMICANSCTQFSKIGITGLDISPPTLVICSSGVSILPVPKAITVHFSVDDIDINMYVGLG